MTNETPSPDTSSGTADQQNSSNSSTNQLREVIPIDSTPFAAIRVDDKYFLALGRYRLSDLKDTLEEIKDHVEHFSWNLLVAVIHAIVKELLEIANNKPPESTN